MNSPIKRSVEGQRPVKLVDAATVIVLREARAADASRSGFEVFMVRRHHNSGFMANAYVYPGGKLDPTDCTEQAAAHARGLSPQKARERLGIVAASGAPESDERAAELEALGLFLAGVRETFEEAGILLACRDGEHAPIDLTGDAARAERFRRYRRELVTGELAISELAAREGLTIPLDRIGYFAHWITPYFEHRRFDTRFFVALAPEHQHPLHDEVETTASCWVRPDEAIARHRAGQILLAPPTLRTLEQLGQFASAHDVLEYAGTYRPPAILPHLSDEDGTPVLLLPGDPAYPTDHPDYRAATPVDDEITRMVLEDGQWYSRPAPE